MRLINKIFKPGKLITPEEHKEKLDNYNNAHKLVKTQKLIAIGYWHSIYEMDLPDPAWFEDKEWDKSERRLVINHLNKGESIADWMGYSWCRFRCDGVHMGCSCLSDGYYSYPEGLTHYLEHHSVRLPIEFIEHIKTFQPIEINFGSEHCDIDFHWWKSQKGWNTDQKSFIAASDEEIKSHIQRVEREKNKKNDNTTF